MKIEFTVSGEAYEDDEMLKIYMEAIETHTVLQEVKDYLRSQLKHGDHSEEVFEALEEVYRRCYEG